MIEIYNQWDRIDVYIDNSYKGSCKLTREEIENLKKQVEELIPNKEEEKYF